MVLKPIYKITANGLDLDLQRQLVSLHITDESGVKSDSCEIVLDDRDSTIAVPQTGTNLSVFLGYEDTGLTLMVTYIVNEVGISGAPNRVSIKAHAADLQSSLKEKISGSFAGQTVGKLVESIAGKHGLVPKIAGDLAGVVIDHIDQTNESDMHFLTRLASKYGAIAKPANGMLVFALKGLAKSVTGMSLGTTTIDVGEVSSWSYTESKRDDYGKVRAEVVNFDSGEIIENVIGEGVAYAVSGTFSDKNLATTIANTVLRGLNRNHQKIQISTVGNTNLIAESKIVLTGFKPGVPAIWTITKAEHTLDSGGFHTQIEGEVYAERWQV
jgi:phage protein D